jgi:hypothetical protein
MNVTPGRSKALGVGRSRRAAATSTGGPAPVSTFRTTGGADAEADGAEDREPAEPWWSRIPTSATIVAATAGAATTARVTAGRSRIATRRA